MEERSMKIFQTPVASILGSDKHAVANKKDTDSIGSALEPRDQFDIIVRHRASRKKAGGWSNADDNSTVSSLTAPDAPSKSHSAYYSSLQYTEDKMWAENSTAASMWCCCTEHTLPTDEEDQFMNSGQSGPSSPTRESSATPYRNDYNWNCCGPEPRKHKRPPKLRKKKRRGSSRKTTPSTTTASLFDNITENEDMETTKSRNSGWRPSLRRALSFSKKKRSGDMDTVLQHRTSHSIIAE